MKMRIEPSKRDYEVYFDNGHHIGTIKYDGFWMKWNFHVRLNNQKLDYYDIKKLGIIMKKFKKGDKNG